MNNLIIPQPIESDESEESSESEGEVTTAVAMMVMVG